MELAQYAKYFDASYTDDVYLYQPTVTNDHGDIVTSWTRQGPIKGSVQDYSGDLAYKEYGIQVDCKKRIFAPAGTIVDAGWGFSSSASDEPELIVKWAPQYKTHRMILAGTR